MKRLLPVAMFLSGCGLLGARAAAAFDVADYKDALAECRKEGTARNSYAVYAQCAHEADIRYGLDGGAQ